MRSLPAVACGTTSSRRRCTQYAGKRLPLFIGAVLVLSFILLTVVFRSLLVPLKAVIMNLLTVGAAYGVLVAVFHGVGTRPSPLPGSLAGRMEIGVVLRQLATRWTDLAPAGEAVIERSNNTIVSYLPISAN